MKTIGWTLLLTLLGMFALGLGGCSNGTDDDDDSADDDDTIDDDSTDDDAADDDSVDDDFIDDDTTPDDDSADDDSVDDDTMDDDTADDDSVDDDTIDDDTADDDSTDDDTADDDTTDDDSADDDVVLPEFIYGTSQGSMSVAVEHFPEMGMRWFRRPVTLRALKPTVTDPELTLEDLMANPSLIDDFAAEANWTSVDADFNTLLNAGLMPFPSTGYGWVGTLPDLNGETATPDLLGKEHYLAQQYRYVRAVVERYDGDGYLDAPGIVLKVWQIENELNQAMLTTLYGWREPSGFAGLTSAWDFLTDLLATINQAAHDADPEAITVQNLHTDIHPNFSTLLGQPSWLEAAELWKDLMDVVGFDAYPNYYDAEPLRGTVVGERAATLAELTGKQTMIVEVGYPTGPAELGYTQELQAQFIDDAFHSAYEAGIGGFLFFGLATDETHSVEITEDDIAALDFVGPHFTDGDVLQLLIWGLTNWDYATDPHFLEVLQSVEEYWGVIMPDGTHKPGFVTLAAIGDELQP